MSRTVIKICGVTRVEDAELAAELGADFLGLNFWPRSPRSLTLEEARPIARAMAGRVRLVGVWVDPQRAELTSTVDALGLDLVQVHGETLSEAVEWFPGRVICGLRMSTDLEPELLQRLASAWGFLIDAAPTGVYGGTGLSWSYESIAELESPKPILVAGGLRPENVAEAISRSGADGVDVCSGVESSPGIKSPELLERFIREVQHAESQR